MGQHDSSKSQTVIVINVTIDKLHSGDDEAEIRHVNVFSWLTIRSED